MCKTHVFSIVSTKNNSHPRKQRNAHDEKNGTSGAIWWWSRPINVACGMRWKFQGEMNNRNNKKWLFWWKKRKFVSTLLSNYIFKQWCIPIKIIMLNWSVVLRMSENQYFKFYLLCVPIKPSMLNSSVISKMSENNFFVYVGPKLFFPIMGSISPKLNSNKGIN